MAVPLLRDDEMKDLEVLAANKQRTSCGCCGLLLYTVHQTVEHLRTMNRRSTSKLYRSFPVAMLAAVS